MLKSVATLLVASLPLAKAADKKPSQIYDLTEVFNQSWLNLGSSPTSSSSSDSSENNKVIMRGFEEGGMFWNTNPLPCDGGYELGLDLYLNLPDALGGSNFEGLGIWIIDNTTMSEISDQYLSHSADRDLFNYRTDYVGYGTFFSMTNRKNLIKPSISVLFNDGTPLTVSDIPTSFGLYHNFTKNAQIQMKFLVKKNHVITKTKTLNGDWKKIAGVSGGQSVCGYLGISASNKRGADKTGQIENLGADLLFVNSTLTTTDEKIYNQMILEALPQEADADNLPKLAQGVPPVEAKRDENHPKELREESFRKPGDKIDQIQREPPAPKGSEKVPNKPEGKILKRSVKPSDQTPPDRALEQALKQSEGPQSNNGVIKTGGQGAYQAVENQMGEVKAQAKIASSQDLETAMELARAQLRAEQYDHSKIEKMMVQLAQNLSKLEASQKKLITDLQNLTKTLNSDKARNLSNEGMRDQQLLVNQQKLDTALADIREMIKKSGESRAINIADTHKSFEDLQANAASLESTVRMASAYSTYLAGGLFVSFIVFGGVIYKRMKDMEKKHFL